MLSEYFQFKILKGFEDIDSGLGVFFQKSDLGLCGHELKLVKKIKCEQIFVLVIER